MPRHLAGEKISSALLQAIKAQRATSLGDWQARFRGLKIISTPLHPYDFKHLESLSAFDEVVRASYA